MESEIRTFRYPKGEMQRVQCVKLDSFSQLSFFRPVFSEEAFLRICDLYRNFIVQKYASLLGRIVIFHLPDDMEIPFEDDFSPYDRVYDRLTAVTLNFRKNIRMKDGRMVFSNQKTADFYRSLINRNALQTVQGKRNHLSFLPISHGIGFMSETLKNAELKVNSSFFVMDLLDCATGFDHVGKPIGLCVKDGRIISPPLFDREALLVRDDSVSIRKTSLNEISVIINDIVYTHGKNAEFFSRPEHARTPKGGFDIIISDSQIVAVKTGGNSPVPSSGFVLHLNDEIKINSMEVSYKGMEDVAFGIQVGNSALVNGRRTEKFISGFHNYKNLLTNVYPPSMYPMNYKKDRAPRMILGCDKDNKPVILWFEGAGKFGYDKEKDSPGASLSEAAEICEYMELENAINLDGGGSAQILINGERELLLSDRDPSDLSERERGIAMGLYI